MLKVLGFVGLGGKCEGATYVAIAPLLGAIHELGLGMDFDRAGSNADFTVRLRPSVCVGLTHGEIAHAP